MITNLSKDSVSILTQANDINHRKAYINSLNGRAELQADQSPKTVAKVMTIWGNAPTLSDALPK